MFWQKEIILAQKRKGFHLITNEIIAQIPYFPSKGLMHLMLLHTSAGLTINENTDPDVALDLHDFFMKSVPENEPYFRHTLEGSDDLPAHIKSSIIGCQLTIPIANNQLKLGIWQGIYLGEFRNQGGSRKIMLTIQGNE